MSLPLKRIVPLDGCVKPSRLRVSVVFPLPLSPTIVRNMASSAGRLNETSSTAMTGSCVPWRGAKMVLTCCRSSRSGVDMIHLLALRDWLSSHRFRVKVTGDPVPVFNLDQWWLDLLAPVHCKGTTRMEAAAAGPDQTIRGLTENHL